MSRQNPRRGVVVPVFRIARCRDSRRHGAELNQSYGDIGESGERSQTRSLRG